MKIKLIRSDLMVAEAFKGNAQTYVCSRGLHWWHLGAIMDVEADGKLLVENGDAEPADEEMEALCLNWRRGRDWVLLSREMLAKGIDPEDRDRFQAGEILGYDTDGNDIPGPNFKDLEEDDDESDSN